MYVSLSQIATSLERLQEVHPFFGFAFLGFKKFELNIGETEEFNYSFIRDNVLDEYFKLGDWPGYFNPFKSTTRWLAPRYESTSLQRIIADTFAPAFIHAKGSSNWGWKPDYVSVLDSIMQKTKMSRIPILDLAVWLYRREDLGRSTADELVSKFVFEFNITTAERKSLFNSSGDRALTYAEEIVSDTDLLNLVGWPEGTAETTGVFVDTLTLSNVGPALKLQYEPSSRMNLVTGDNSVGKTFLLDCLWWSLTGEWMDYPADPSTDRNRKLAEIDFSLRSRSGRVQAFEAPYNPVGQDWQRPPQPFQGIALYSDYSGGAAVWDQTLNEPRAGGRQQPYMRMRRQSIWDGLSIDERGRRRYLSNGLIHDWVSWQGNTDNHIWKAFEACLTALSPPDGISLRPGRPVRVPNDSREMPTVRMPYGSVPVIYASAGIQRILAIGYMMVWSWFRHLDEAKRQRREPLRNMVVVIDEIEAHLHPRWQRQIIPALTEALRVLQSEVAVQLHISTHSPLVLASAEPLFDQARDAIHNLKYDEGAVSLSVISDWKQGSVDYWLESDIFGLGRARSLPAERAMQDAVEIQKQQNPSSHLVRQIHDRLVRLLPDDDPFWPRWVSFYERHSSSTGRPRRA